MVRLNFAHPASLGPSASTCEGKPLHGSDQPVATFVPNNQLTPSEPGCKSWTLSRVRRKRDGAPGIAHGRSFAREVTYDY